uniref:Transmembrane protein 106C n=1 Tax=Accipiter nisus TaxID=211598 RepID=A0A8B9MT31_9AVES
MIRTALVASVIGYAAFLQQVQWVLCFPSLLIILPQGRGRRPRMTTKTCSIAETVWKTLPSFRMLNSQVRTASPVLLAKALAAFPQVNELVALIPYSDQRLRPQRTKLYVLLSVLLCLLISGLVVFFLFPHSVLVDDDGIKVVQVWFDKKNSVVILAITATLRIRNSNFYSVTVPSLTSQVQYMNTVVGTQQITNVSSIQPLSDKLVNFTVKAELGGPFSYVYFFCTFPKVKVHNIVIFMRTSVKLSYIGHVTQSALETYHYVDCSTNSTAAQDPLPPLSPLI